MRWAGLAVYGIGCHGPVCFAEEALGVIESESLVSMEGYYGYLQESLWEEPRPYSS
jgi:hypothetical protein